MNFAEAKEKILIGMFGISAAIIIGLANSINSRLGVLVENAAKNEVTISYIKQDISDLKVEVKEHTRRLNTIEYFLKPEEIRLKNLRP